MVKVFTVLRDKLVGGRGRAELPAGLLVTRRLDPSEITVRVCRAERIGRH
ncbi:hypothetical protein [Nocardia terpenica]|uniref:Uncharacterized protein n=1 Tax=Nocardia terpenica TaxID=455432 RepID=A0A6G9Z6V6_9NOCA|nr:hypothetical protein [Nocardia terpenica]QIS21345.1 hypothetical protein F6W96_26455 [Nocardia terpenica]